MKKKISGSQLVNIALGLCVVLLLIFGYFYWKGLNPVEVVSSTITPEVPTFEYQFSMYGGKKNFDNPYEVLAFNNSVYVSDFNNGRIVVLDRTGKVKQEIVNKEVYHPAGMFWDGSRLWVAGADVPKVLVMNPNGQIIDRIQLPKGSLVADIAVKDGFMYWLNNGKMNIEKYDLNAKKNVKSFGGYGKDNGQVYFPYDLNIKDDRLYVADSMNNRINIYDLNGKYLDTWAKGKPGEKSGGLAVPRGIAFDKKGRLFTVEGIGQRVTALAPDGKVLLNISKTETIGEEVQDMNLPTDVTFDEYGSRLYVLETAFKRVLVYKIK